jgi:bifunctional non-homologous end joining protein LigD
MLEPRASRDLGRHAPCRCRSWTSLLGLRILKLVTEAVKLTHPEKLLYPECGVTKQRLFDYYARVAKWMLPHVAKRPLNFRRCPNGWKRGFFQQHAQGKVPKGLRSVAVQDASGDSNRLTLDDATGLLQLAQMNVLEIHTWGAHVDDVDKPDLLVFDLDPDPSVTWAAVLTAARKIRQRLGDAGVESFVKTTGGKGLHICAAIERTVTWDRARTFCQELSERIVADEPDKYIATMSKAKRKGKIFLDFFRNGKGATFIAPYSTRARENCPVAMPVTWEELGPDLKPNGWSIDATLARLDAHGDAWAPMLAKPQRLPS